MGHEGTTEIRLRVPGRRDAIVTTTWNEAGGAARGWAWVQHGFSRGARHLEGLAGLLAANGFVVVRPDLASFTPWHSMHDRAFLSSVALTISRAVEEGIPQDRGVPVPPDLPWIGVGHSAGCAVVAQAAAVLGSRGRPASRLVFLDPVDTVGHLMAGALPSLEECPIAVLACPPSRCNRRGEALELLGPLGHVTITRMDGVAHADPERIPPRLVPGLVPPEGWAVARVCGPGGPTESILRMGEWTVSASARENEG